MLKPIQCSICGAPCSTPIPDTTVVRAWIQCPECVEKESETQEDIDSPYCPTCGACGESGCCPPDMCQHLEKNLMCMYGEHYAREYHEVIQENDKLIKVLTHIEKECRGTVAASIAGKALDDMFVERKELKQ